MNNIRFRRAIMNNASEQSCWPARLTQLAFVLATSATIARATIVEITREPTPTFVSTLPVPKGASPTTSLVLDLLLCAAAAVVLLRRMLDADYRLHLRPSHLLFAAIALLATASSLWASDKFLAVVNSSHLVAAAALMWTISQLARSWLKVRIVCAACLAVLLVYFMHGLLYRTVDLPDVLRYWHEHKAQELAARGWEPDSFQARQFEKKLLAGEMMGFNTSPNSFAAMVVMLGITSAGLAIQRARDGDRSGLAVAILVAIVLMASVWLLWHTASRTALVTSLLAAVILFIAPRLARWRRSLYLLCCVLILAAATLAIVHALRHSTLFHDSLTFRWRYWVGAAKIFHQHPILGIGWANFGSHYLGVRLPAASEEIKDPHNLVVRTAAELGLIGGILMLVWLGRLGWELIVPDTRKSTSGKLSLRTIALICFGAILINTLASVDFSLSSPEGQWYIMLELLKRLLYLLMLLGGMLIVLALADSTSGNRLKHDGPSHAGRPAPWMRRAVATAVAIFLVHNLIDFSLFEPGPMCTFAMLAGTALATDDAESGTKRIRTLTLPRMGFFLAAILWLAAALGVVLPIGLAESLARRADENLRQAKPATAAQQLQAAFEQCWIANADYAYRAALAMQQAGMPPDRVRMMLDAAISADPMSVQYYRARAEHELRQPQPDPRRVITDFEKVIALNPNDVLARCDFADVLALFGLRQRAIEQYRAALHCNDLLDPADPRRLTASQIADIQQRMQAIE